MNGSIASGEERLFPDSGFQEGKLIVTSHETVIPEEILRRRVIKEPPCR